MDNKICPNCKQTLLYIHTVLTDNDVKYEVCCSWCNYTSKLYNNKWEVKQDYENAILRL